MIDTFFLLILTLQVLSASSVCPWRDPRAFLVAHLLVRITCDGRTPGPHTRGTSPLPVKKGPVHSRHGRSDPVRRRQPLALAREICSTDTYLESFRWRSTCDHPVAHQPQPLSRDFTGTSKSHGWPPVKGLTLCKSDLDH